MEGHACVQRWGTLVCLCVWKLRHESGHDSGYSIWKIPERSWVSSSTSVHQLAQDVTVNVAESQYDTKLSLIPNPRLYLTLPRRKGAELSTRKWQVINLSTGTQTLATSEPPAGLFKTPIFSHTPRISYSVGFS